MATYGVSKEISAEACENIKIIHPYGCIGKLPWQTMKNGDVVFEYGHVENNLSSVYNKIRTFNEENNCDNVSLVKKIIEDYELIVFLGFGFHDQNISFIRPNLNNKSKTILGTVYGFSDFNSREIERKLGSIFSIDRNMVQIYLSKEDSGTFIESVQQAL